MPDAFRTATPSPPWWLSVKDLLGRDQFGWFTLAAAGMLIATPRALVAGYDVLMGQLGYQATRPNLEAWPHVPGVFFVAVALALGTFFLQPRTRLKVLTAAIAPLAVLHGRLDVQSVIPVTFFLLAAFAVVRLPIARVRAGLLTIVLSLGTLIACDAFLPGSAAVRFAGSWAMLVPMLWYSAYEHERRSLPLSRFLAYMSGRFFGAPVYTYTDLVAIGSGPQLRTTRWAGVRTIYVALLASGVVALAGQLIRLIPPDRQSGAALLALSYIRYVGDYCEIVVGFNLVIGVLRLFGVPIRPNFRNWLLARTPNEHWQRWNVLFREWILTFVFFPIMRSRRWLFAAVMAALLASGLLHVVPLGLTRGLAAPQILAHSLYWVINALAIYLVLKIPQLAPQAVGRLRLGERRAWSVAGVVLTSLFYAVLHGFRTESESWAELRDYALRLIDLSVIDAIRG